MSSLAVLSDQFGSEVVDIAQLANGDFQIFHNGLGNKFYNQLLWEMKTTPNSDAKLYGLVATFDGNGNLYVLTREADHQVLKAYSPANEDAVPGTYPKAMQVVGDTLMLVRFDKIDTENDTYYFQQFDMNGEATSVLGVDSLNYDFYLTPFQNNSCLMMTTDRAQSLSCGQRCRSHPDPGIRLRAG